MNFAETIQQVGDALEAHALRAGDVHLREHYVQVRDMLARRLVEADTMIELAQALRAGEASLTELAAVAETMADATATMLADFQQAPDQVVRQSDRWAALEEHEHAFGEIAEQSYEEFREQLQTAPLPMYYTALARTGPLRDAWDRVQRADTDLPRLLPETLPADAARLASARRLKREREAAAAELQRAVPQNVAAFLDRAAEGRASLAELDAEVLSWLREQGAAGSIRVLLR